MANSKKSPEISALSFEGALAELEDIVRRLEQGKSDLEDAIEAYERGAALKKHCETKLKEAKARVEKIKLGADGAEGLEPTDLE
ncbi:MAG: exodeoxyribonuclease VII small subunit [Alphaproteobacteria bacterium]|jgi:exodeoxyribonuclease VII small subunit